LIISVGQANLREKPDAKSRILQTLSKGTKLVVVSKGNQWYRVRLDNGREGWVAESVVTPAP
jgi:N-acetylmuramoyl-L-alanine amidase